MTTGYDQMSERAESALFAQMTRLVQAFGLNEAAPGRLTEIARAEIERDERFVDSPGARSRAVSRARQRLASRRSTRR